MKKNKTIKMIKNIFMNEVYNIFLLKYTGFKGFIYHILQNYRVNKFCRNFLKENMNILFDRDMINNVIEFIRQMDYLYIRKNDIKKYPFIWTFNVSNNDKKCLELYDYSENMKVSIFISDENKDVDVLISRDDNKSDRFYFRNGINTYGCDIEKEMLIDRISKYLNYTVVELFKNCCENYGYCY